MDTIRLTGNYLPFEYFYCEFCKIQIPNEKRMKAMKKFEAKRKRVAEKYKQPYIPLYLEASPK